MEKRLLLAISLSLLILLSWSTWVSKTQHIVNKEVITKIPPSINTPANTTSYLNIEPEPPAASLLKFDQEKFEITFIESQAAIKEVVFKTYQNYRFPLKYGFLLADNSLSFKKENISSNAVTFVYKSQSRKVVKKFTFFNSDYTLRLDIEVENLSNLPLVVNFPLVLGVLDFAPQNIQTRYQDVTVSAKDKVLHLNARKAISLETIKFLSLRDRYFCAIIEPELNHYAAFIRQIKSQSSEVGLEAMQVTLAPGQKIEQKFHIYLGPQDLKLINRLKPDWSAVLYYGTFGFISHLLLQFLEFLYQLVHNWGWAIVILSFAIYFLLYPLTLKQMRSMKEMQALQPHIEELRKMYKDNPQKLNKEIMQLYHEHKVNPLGGCLPVILQIPIFFALYQALMRFAAFKGAKFLWIKDLSEPDRLFILPVSLPILGNEINILPIIMAIGMFIQQKTSLATAAGSSAEQQKLMSILFPIMFGLIFYRMPSGLVLYWFINSTLMLVYQLRISRKR